MRLEFVLGLVFGVC